MGNWMHNGYSNYSEWKKKNPDSYWKYVNGMIEKVENQGKLSDDEYLALAAKLSTIKVDPNDKFSEVIGRAVRGELTEEEIAICNEDQKGVTVPLPPKKWYARLWNWIKSLFVKSKTIDDFEQDESSFADEYPTMSRIAKVVSPEPKVTINKEFDFQDWMIERRDRIIKAIKDDGQEENIIICPVCYDKRQYYIASGGHIHSSCDKCGIRLTQ